MGGKTHNAVLRELAAFAQAFDLALGGAGPEPNVVWIGIQPRSNRAKLLSCLWQWHLHAKKIAVGKSASCPYLSQSAQLQRLGALVRFGPADLCVTGKLRQPQAAALLLPSDAGAFTST